jgi:aryl-alcohol dehydrogenase-like predicted oxidoreductase
MPLLQDQRLGLMVWSPLGWGRLTGKIRRGSPLPEGRAKAGGLVGAPPVADEHLYNVVDVLEQIAAETGRPVSQIAINWLLQNKTVSNIIIGARNEEQLQENIEATGWNLSAEQLLKLDAVSEQVPIYPHWVGKR